MRIVSQVLALIVLTSSIAAASGSTASWSPAVVSKVEVGQVGKSSFTITAWVDLPTQCYAARIDHQTPVDTKSPGYFVQKDLAVTTPCSQVVFPCTVATSFTGDVPSAVTVQYIDKITNQLSVKKYPVESKPPSEIKTTCKKGT